MIPVDKKIFLEPSHKAALKRKLTQYFRFDQFLNPQKQCICFRCGYTWNSKRRSKMGPRRNVHLATASIGTRGCFTAVCGAVTSMIGKTS